MADDPKTTQDPYAAYGGATETNAADDPYKAYGGGVDTAPAAAAPKPATNPQVAPPPDPNAPNPYVQAVKGAARGAAENFAAQGTVDPNEPFFSSKNAISGLKATRDMYAKTAADAAMTGGASIPIGMVKGLYGAGDELWHTKFADDPESFGHALGSAATQLLMLRSIKKGITEGEIPPDKATSSLASGFGITGPLVDAFRKSGIVKVMQDAGVRTIGGAIDATRKASDFINDKFNQALVQIGGTPYIPTEIANRINALITPDMAKTPEGRAQIKEIQAAARQYTRPWSLNELNAKRMTENDNLNSFYDRDSQGQNASALDQHISKAVRDGAADIVYGQMEKTGKLPNAQQMKAQQGALWDLEIHLKDRANQLDAQQMEHGAQSPVDKLKPRVGVSESGKARGYVAGLADAVLGGDPKAAANAKINRGAHPTIGDKLAPYKAPVHAWPVVGLLSKDGTIDDGTRAANRLNPPPMAPQ